MTSAVRHWPAEWERHTATWLAWPHNPNTWPGRIQHIPPIYASFVRMVAEVEPVKLLANETVARGAAKWLKGIDNVELIPISTNDCWVRDYGPTFVRSEGQLVAVHWKYNAWGGKYPPWELDAANGRAIAQSAAATYSPSPLCAEGGAIETNGQGVLLTTPECLHCDSRNAGWSVEAIENELKLQLGVHEVLWLQGGGIEGDDTDGHIDQLARFVRSDAIVCAVCDDPNDPNHRPLERNYQQLVQWGKHRPQPVEVHRLPLPPPRHINGQRVPESYCNFIFAGNRILVPTYRNTRADAVALEMIRHLSPAANVIGLDASELAWGLGAFHCASQQQCTVA
jgi:agmatine deiminase